VRTERIASKIKAFGADCYITLDQSERLYLTNFSSSFGIVIVTSKGEGIFITDGRYIERAKEEVKGFRLVQWKGWDNLLSLLKEEKIESAVIDPDRIKLSTYQKLKESIEIKSYQGFLSEFRSVKEEEEIVRIARAVQTAELALKSVLHLLKPGITELEFRRELISAFFKLGGEGEAFPTIVASGKGSAVPHWETSNKEIKDGEVVIVDFGTRYKGYVSDITRTFLVGKVPEKIREIYEVVREAQELGVKELKEGKSCREVDLAVRKFIESKNFGEFFVHSTGHGIGLEVHEAPTLSKNSNEILRKNNVVTVEPGIYLPGLGGVRIEDDCLVTESGSFRLSELPR